MLVYTLITGPLIALGEVGARSLWTTMGVTSKLVRLGLVGFFFVRMGLPPFPRFFIKVEVILALVASGRVFGSISLRAGAAGILLLYLSLVVGGALSRPAAMLRLHLTSRPLIYLTSIFMVGGVLL